MEHQSSEQTEILKEILKWIKFTAAKEIRNVLLVTLDSEQRRQIYNLSDGNRSSMEIAKLVGTSDTTIRRYWASWVRQGIVESLRVRGGERYKKSFELEDFGIEVPQLKIVTQPVESKGVEEEKEQREKK